LAFILDREVIEKILRHLGEEEHPPSVAPASDAQADGPANE
jgi:hypothetical protein